MDLDPGKPVTSVENGPVKLSCTNDQLVWSLSTWMYDWLEVTNELQAVVNKLRSKYRADKKERMDESMPMDQEEEVASAGNECENAQPSKLQEVSEETKKTLAQLTD